MVQTDPDGFHASIPLDIPTPTMTSTDSPVLIHEKSEGVVTLTLNRPEKRNAINNAMAINSAARNFGSAYENIRSATR